MKSLSAVLTSVFICCQCSVSYAANRTTTLSVSGMDCAACPITVKKALSRVDGVSEVKVNIEKKQAMVTFDDAKTTVNALIQAAADAGYPSAIYDSSAK